MSTAGEKAMALVDGQLAPADLPDLVEELARNAPLVAEVQEYLALSRNRLASPFAAMGEEPVPGRLVDAIMQAPAPAPIVAPAGQPLLARVLAWLRGSYRVPAWSLAAAPALAALMMVAVWWAAPAPGRGPLLEADLGPALERTESGKDASLGTVRPVLTFHSKAAGWCRQFDVRHTSRQVSHALACRGADGRWEVVASTPPARTGLTPAGSDRRRAIDDLAASMMRGDPLSPADETKVIGGGWRRL
jgi:hypothetical protein